MTRALRAWLEKATLTSDDLSGGTNGGLLSPQQVRQFLRLVIDQSVLIGECRQETSISTKFEVPRIGFTGRLLRNGTQAKRLDDADRKKPATGLVTLSTSLFKGEVLVGDEFFEDNVELDGASDTLMTMIAEAVGRDVEEIAIKSDTDRGVGEDETLDQFDGIIASHQDGLPGPQQIDATSISAATDLFRTMIEALPAKYRRDYSALRFYVPVTVADVYHDELTERGTPLGDQATTDKFPLRYRGVPIVSVPLLSGEDDIDSDPIDYSTFAWLTDPRNTIVGWHRRVRIEKFRDPREGATSFLPTVRFDVKHADPNYGVLASNISLPAGS